MFIQIDAVLDASVAIDDGTRVHDAVDVAGQADLLSPSRLASRSTPRKPTRSSIVTLSRARIVPARIQITTNAAMSTTNPRRATV